MNKILKNILIFVVIAVVLGLGYYLFTANSSSAPSLVVSSTTSTVSPTSNTASTSSASAVGTDFFNTLLGVKNIKLDDSIFSDSAFLSLQDSSITLTADPTQGRPNPFAPFSISNGASSSTSINSTTSAVTIPPSTSPLNSSTTTPVIPVKP